MAAKTQIQQRKRGIRDAIVAVTSAAMIMAPGYVADILIGRLRIATSIAAVLSIAIFLVGVFLLVRLLKD
jgi:type IV secretory pathway TrbD component